MEKKDEPFRVERADSHIDSPPAFESARSSVDWQDSLADDDGRISFDLSRGVKKLPSGIKSQFQVLQNESFRTSQSQPLRAPSGSPPPLNIVMQVVGSQGDVQPFVALGRELEKYGHRVRVATHPAFRQLVETNGLEFFSIGGNPYDLMAYMVKNPGLWPTLDTIRQGELHRNRRTMRNIMRACWRSCFEPAQLSDVEGKGEPKPFVADAIIANPPSFAHIHCAERLGIPLHLVFTMPWSPTQEFPHPLAKVKAAEPEAKMANFLSFYLIESMLWHGLGDIVNRFRYKVLGLEPVDSTQAPGLLQRFHIPYSYCWSPSLVPKPSDWAPNVNVSGFLSLPTPDNYEPPEDLLDFLGSGTPPVYIGFGSIVVEDPVAMTNLIRRAIRLAGVRAIVSQGWAGLDCRRPHSISVDDNDTTDPSILSIGPCPHTFLFPRVSAVVHHGGAGTTASGLAAGKPSVLIPFFGDQFFWANTVYRSGAGPRPIPAKALTAENLAAAIVEATSDPYMLRHAGELALRIRAEDGVKATVDNFHACLPESVYRGDDLIPARAAVWRYTKKSRKLNIKLNLSALAATSLCKEKILVWEDLEAYQPCKYDISHHGPYEPVSGATMAVGDFFYESFKGMGEILFEFVRVPYIGQRKIWSQNQADAMTKGKMRAFDEMSVTSSSTTATRDGRRIGVEGLPLPQTAHHDEEAESGFGIPGKHMVKGTLRIGKAAARAPGEFSLAMARGAHNAPKLWGDRTVRPQNKVTGVVSGVQEGVKELALGVGDGITGLFVQPVLGFAEEGMVGIVKGTSKGVLGLPVKFFAAACGIVGYPLKGIDVEVTNALRGDRGAKAIRHGRMLQGEMEWAKADEESKAGVLRTWRHVTAQNKPNGGIDI